MPLPSPVEDQLIHTTLDARTRLSLRANFSWTFLGNLIYTGCQWGMIVILAKLGSSEMVGQFSLGLAVTAPLMMLASLRMRLAQATDAKSKYRFGDYLGLRLITNFLALLIIVVIAFFTKYELEIALVILTVGVAKFIEGTSDVFYGFFQQNERMDRMAISMIIKGFASLAVLGVGIYFTRSLIWATTLMAAAWAFVFLIYDIPNGAKLFSIIHPTTDQTKNRFRNYLALAPRWDWRILVKLGWLLLPLGFVALFTSLHVNIPRYFIEHNLGVAELGIFAAIASFDRAGNLIVKALAQSSSPRLSQYYSAGNKAAFISLLMKTVGIGILLGVAGVLVVLIAGKEILTIAYQPEYARKDIFIIVMIAAGLEYIATFVIYGVSATRTFQIQAVMYTVSTIILIVALMIMISLNGLNGVAMAILISKGVLLFSSVVVIFNELRKFNPLNSQAG
jgi:O-antigen/teichoic acid export membrane protein